MVLGINLNWNNRSVVASRFSLLCEKTEPIFPLLEAVWQADKILVDFKKT